MTLESILGEPQLDVAALLLRVALGGLFIYHGYPKMKDMGKGTGQWVKSIGIPAAIGPIGAIAEFLGGIAILLGILTPIVAGLFIPWTVGLIWVSKFKIKKKFAGGYELDLLLFFVSVILLLVGGGVYSIDHLIGI